jgi:hypothetical protein
MKLPLSVIGVVLLCLCGCGSTSPSSEQIDELKGIRKSVDEMKSSIEGNNNTITKLSSSVDTNTQTTNKINEQIGAGAKLTAEKIDGFKQDFSQIKNSSWMVWGIVALETIVIIVAMLGFIGLIYVYVKQNLKIHKVIAADDNDLTFEKWEKIK